MKNAKSISVILVIILLLSFFTIIVSSGDTSDAVDGNLSNMDSSADIGTETNFANCQATTTDSSYMNIQEADTGSAGVSEWLENDADATTLSNAAHAGSSVYLAAVDTTNKLTITKAGGYARWYTFDNTVGGAGTYTVNISIYVISGDGNDDMPWQVDTNGDDSAEYSGTITDPTSGWYTMSVGSLSQANVNSARAYISATASSKFNTIVVDAVRLGVDLAAVNNYTIDFEYDWDNAVNNEANEEVCFYLGGSLSENLNVSYWTDSAWSHLGFITSTGWTNLTATGLADTTYEIRINGTSETSDSTQNNWDIDCLFLHTWTSANTAPTQANPGPANGATGISLLPILNVTVDDAEDDTLTATWRSNSSGPWVTFDTNNSIDTSGGSVNISQTNINFSKGTTKYYWSVNLTDGNGGWTNATYHFTTEDWIWIDITNTSWGLGNVVMSSNIWTNETGKTFIADMDNTSVNTDLKLQITSDGADWTAATTGNGPGANVYRLNASINTWIGENQILTASQTTISSSISAWTNESFDLRFDAPISTSTGDQQSVTVTATLIKS